MEKPEPKRSSLQAALAGGVASVFGGGKAEEEKKEKDKPRGFSISAVDNLLPKIRRGFLADEAKEDDAMVVGWKSEVRSRKEREEVLRYVYVAPDAQTFCSLSNSPSRLQQRRASLRGSAQAIRTCAGRRR